MAYKISTLVLFFCLSIYSLSFAQNEEEKDYYATFLTTTNLEEAATAIDNHFKSFYDDDVNRQIIENFLLRQLNQRDISLDCQMEIPQCMNCPDYFSPHNPENVLAMRYRGVTEVDSFRSTYFDIENGLGDSITMHQAGVFFEDLPINTNKLFTFQFYCGDFGSELFIIIIDKDIDLRGALDDLQSGLTLPGGNTPNEAEVGSPPPPLPLQVFPNPAQQQVQINVQLAKPQPNGVSIALFDFLTGRQVRSVINQQALVRGQHVFSLDTAELPNGNYFLEVRGEDIHQVQKLLILH